MIVSKVYQVFGLLLSCEAICPVGPRQWHDHSRDPPSPAGYFQDMIRHMFQQNPYTCWNASPYTAQLWLLGVLKVMIHRYRYCKSWRFDHLFFANHTGYLIKRGRLDITYKSERILEKNKVDKTKLERLIKKWRGEERAMIYHYNPPW